MTHYIQHNNYNKIGVAKDFLDGARHANKYVTLSSFVLYKEGIE
jgi:hypothetical protein